MQRSVVRDLRCENNDEALLGKGHAKTGETRNLKHIESYVKHDKNCAKRNASEFVNIDSLFIKNVVVLRSYSSASSRPGWQ